MTVPVIWGRTESGREIVENRPVQRHQEEVVTTSTLGKTSSKGAVVHNEW